LLKHSWAALKSLSSICDELAFIQPSKRSVEAVGQLLKGDCKMALVRQLGVMEWVAVGAALIITLAPLVPYGV
jgi:hypothetical protein